MAVVDFQLKNLTGARAGPQAFAASQVRVLNTRPVAPPNADEGATSKAGQERILGETVKHGETRNR